MIQLFLNNTQVIPAESNIKITKVNSFVTQAGEYTYEIALPLSIAENAKFFPNWKVLQTTRSKQKFTAELYLDSVPLLIGNAKITKATEQIVYVQLLSAFSDIEKLHGEEYIDELLLPGYEYGYVQQSYSDEEGLDETALMKSLRKWNYKPHSYFVNAEEPFLNITRRPIGDPDKFTVFPVFDNTFQAVCNYMRGWRLYGVEYRKDFIYNWQGGFKDSQTGSTESPLKAVGFSPNWNLLFVIKAIFEAFGYNLDTSNYGEPWSRLYLAMPGSAMAEALPHWTVKEFLEQIRLFFNASFEFSGKNVVMKSNKELSLNAKSFEPIDEYSIEINEDSEKGANKFEGYKYQLSDVEYHTADVVEDEIINGVDVHKCNSYSIMRTLYNSATEEKKANDLWYCPEGYYCQWDGELKRVDIFGKIDKTGDVEETELKIVPAAMVYVFNDALCHYNMPVLEQILPDTVEPDSDTVQAYIEGNSSIEDKKKKFDLMEVAFCDRYWEEGDAYYKFTIPSAFTAPERPYGVTHEHWSLSFREAPGTTTMSELFGEKSLSFDASKKYRIKFLSDKLVSADSIFIFNNRKFIPEKLEIDVSNGELSKIVTGDFYEIR